MTDTFEDVARSKYLLLTTFTKDGRAKPTTVWGVKDGDKLLISTDDGSWKTKRINNTPRVTIQRSTALGKPTGEPVEAVARNLPKARQSTGLRHGHQEVLVARVVVDSAGDRARRGRQSPQCRRGQAGLAGRQVFVEEREHAGVGVLGRRVVVSETRNPD